jgi:hypothetical protein
VGDISTEGEINPRLVVMMTMVSIGGEINQLGKFQKYFREKMWFLIRTLVLGQRRIYLIDFQKFNWSDSVVERSSVL